MRDDELLFNKIAQGRLTFAEGVAWFTALDQAQQQATLTTTLPQLIQQAHPTAQLITQALETAPVKPTVTPIVLFQAHPFPLAMHKVKALPVTEWRNVFIVLLRLFAVADTHRRETQCQDGCSHEWHNLP
jgi:hypothetical protein